MGHAHVGGRLEGLFAAKREGPLVGALSPTWGGENESVPQPDRLSSCPKTSTCWNRGRWLGSAFARAVQGVEAELGMLFGIAAAPSCLTLRCGVKSCSCVGHGEQHRNCLKPNICSLVSSCTDSFFFLSFGLFFFFFVTLSACFGIGVMNQNSVAKQSSLHYSVAFATETGCISQKGLVLLTAGQS